MNFNEHEWETLYRIFFEVNSAVGKKKSAHVWRHVPHDIMCFFCTHLFQAIRFGYLIETVSNCVTEIPAVSLFSVVIGSFLRPLSGSMTLGSFTCPHTHPQAQAFTIHRSCWKSMKTSRLQQRCVCLFIPVCLWICYCRQGDCMCF